MSDDGATVPVAYDERRRGRGQAYTPGQVIAAIRAHHGMVYLAAQALGCTGQTVRNYAARYERVRDALAEERGLMADVTESALFLAIHNGEPWAIA
jgi:hypothetical protein